MTVRQICDVLLERHPDTAQLLTKTLNLVLAKLNAYVKKVERGEHVQYILTREWAEALPRRMVYVCKPVGEKNVKNESPPAKVGPKIEPKNEQVTVARVTPRVPRTVSSVAPAVLAVAAGMRVAGVAALGVVGGALGAPVPILRPEEILVEEIGRMFT